MVAVVFLITFVADRELLLYFNTFGIYFTVGGICLGVTGLGVTDLLTITCLT